MESNTRNSKVFTVRHERYTKKGTFALSDPRDVYENNANLAARRLRAVILATVPGDVVEAAVAQCEQTLKAKADTSPEAMKKMVETFAVQGVTKEQIEKRIQRRIESITAAQVVSLRKIFNSIRDGMSTPADWFETIDAKTADTPKTTGAEALKRAIKDKPKSPPQEDSRPAPSVQIVVEDPIPGEQILCPYSEKSVDTSFCLNACADKAECKAWPA